MNSNVQDPKIETQHDESRNSIAKLLCLMSEGESGSVVRRECSQQLPATGIENHKLGNMHGSTSSKRAETKSALPSQMFLRASVNDAASRDSSDSNTVRRGSNGNSGSCSPPTSSSSEQVNSDDGNDDTKVPPSSKRHKLSPGYSSLTTTTAEGVSESETDQASLSSKRMSAGMKIEPFHDKKIPAARPSYQMNRELNSYPYFYYVDRSRDYDDDPLSPLSPPLCVPNFVIKLHAILIREDLKHIVSFLPHGRSWKVLDAKEFERKVLPDYFKQSNINSFHRQANGWGFRRMLKGPDKGAFYNENFLRGLPFLCKKMRRIGGAKFVEDSNISHEPDLWKISEDHPLPDQFFDDLNYTVLKTINKCVEEEGPKAKLPFIHNLQKAMSAYQSTGSIRGSGVSNCFTGSLLNQHNHTNSTAAEMHNNGGSSRFKKDPNPPLCAGVPVGSEQAQDAEELAQMINEKPATIRRGYVPPSQATSGHSNISSNGNNEVQNQSARGLQFRMVQEAIFRLQQQQQHQARESQNQQQQHHHRLQQQLLQLLNTQQQVPAQIQQNQMIEENRILADLICHIQQTSPGSFGQTQFRQLSREQVTGMLGQLLERSNLNNPQVAIQAPCPFVLAPATSLSSSSTRTAQHSNLHHLLSRGNAPTSALSDISLADVARQVLARSNNSDLMSRENANATRPFDLNEILSAIIQQKQGNIPSNRNIEAAIIDSGQCSGGQLRPSTQTEQPPGTRNQIQNLGQQHINQQSFQTSVESIQPGEYRMAISNPYYGQQQTVSSQQHDTGSSRSDQAITDLVTRAVLSGMQVGPEKVVSSQQHHSQH